MSLFLEGFLLQASLILVLGAQNIFILEQGLRRERHYAIALLSAICDSALVFIGVLGVATFFIQFIFLKILLGFAGVAFLLIYGFLKLKESVSAAADPSDSDIQQAKKGLLMTCLAVSLLNPHVYLDNIVLVGGYSTKFVSLQERLYFGFGVASFSTVWFFVLASLASILSSFLNNKKMMRRVSFLSGLVLVLLSIKLGADVYSWLVAWL